MTNAPLGWLVAAMLSGSAGATAAAEEGAAPWERPAVSLTLDASSLVLGVDQEAELRISVRGPGVAELGPPQVIASAGRIEDLVPVGPGEFTARYVLPAERFPQAAILVARFPAPGPPLWGFLPLRLRAAASPAFVTDPGAQVTLRVGDREFGPQTAARDGHVRLTVVVPPGAPFAMARSVNEFGKATEQPVDLKLPPFRRVLVVAPQAVEAGATVEVAVFAVDASGFPEETTSLRLQAPLKAQPLGGAPGQARFLVRAPAVLRDPVLRLEAAVHDQPETQTVVEVPLVPDRPTKLDVRPDRSRLPIGHGSSMRVSVTAMDRFANPVHPTDVSLAVDGEPVDARTDGKGQVTAIVEAPSAFDGRRTLAVEAVLGQAYARQVIPLTNLPPAPPPAPIGPPEPPRLTLAARLGFLWGIGQNPGPAALVEVLGRAARWPESLLVGALTGFLSSEAVAWDGLGLSRVTMGRLPVVVVGRARHRVGRRIALALGAGAGVTQTWAVVRSFGRDIRGTKLAPTALVDGEAALTLGQAKVLFGVHYFYVPVGRLSSGDSLRGNTGGLVGDVGYRIAW